MGGGKTTIITEKQKKPQNASNAILVGKIMQYKHYYASNNKAEKLEAFVNTD